MIRLIRRALLCLVVGVTAFGVAGWGMRPKPKWTLELVGSDYWSLGQHGSVDDRLLPCWAFAIGTNRSGYDPDAPGSIYAVSGDGRVLRRESTPIGQPFVAADGTLVMVHSGDRDGQRSKRITLHPPSDGPVVSRLLEKDWRLCDDGLHASGLSQAQGAPVYEVIDLRAAKVEASLRLAHYDPEKLDATAHIAHSPKKGLLAVCEAARSDRKPPFGIELFEVATGAFVKRLIPPNARTTKSGCATRPRFVDDGQKIEFTWRQDDESDGDELVRIGLGKDPPQTGTGRAQNPEFETVDTVSRIEILPELKGGARRFIADKERDGRRLWETTTRKPDAVWYGVDDGVRSVAGWRRYPADARIDPLHFQYTAAGPGPGFHWGYDPLGVLVPDAAAFCVAAEESPTADNFPEALARLLPDDSPLRSRQTVLRWHNWERGDWRAVGDIGPFHDFQIRADQAIVLTRNEGRQLLQSWPLPPRDPKPPALAIAALCMAGTWWLCAWRYRRRMRTVA